MTTVSPISLLTTALALALLSHATPLLPLLVSAAPTLTTPTSPFAFSVLFGDSHSDYINMYALKGFQGMPGPPFYAPGRRSDGPVWAEYLNAKLGLENLNEAWEGAFLDNAVHGWWF